MSLLAGLLLAAAHAQAVPAPAAEACPTPPTSQARPWLDPGYTPNCRARFVLARLGTDDKLALVETSGFGAPAPGRRDVMAELGLKPATGSDGPAGFNGGTAWPTPLALAASFDPDLAARFGAAMGREFHLSGRNLVLGPAMDMTRTWRFGRSTESFGEDPFLAGAMTGPEVAAIQSQHVMATIKHFAAYTQEQGRVGDSPLGFGPAVDQQVSERALREIYFPAFRAAVEIGKAGAVMCSFPRINGAYACENPFTLGVLKREWGFDGAVGPDFPDGQRSVVPAVLAGLDSGRFEPSTPPDWLGSESLKAAIASGRVPLSRLDDLVMRRLVPGFRIGTFDHPALKASDDVVSPASLALAAEIAEAGAVLLKNQGAVLPFGPDVKSIAVIGAQAGAKAEVVEQGSAYVEPRHLVPALWAIKQRAGDRRSVVYAQGTPGLRGLPAAPVKELKAEYFPTPDLDGSGPAFATRSEPGLAMAGLPKIEGLPANKMWSVRWTGVLTPSATGVQRFTLEGSGSARLYVDGVLQDRFDNADFGAIAYANVPSEAGKPMRIEVRYSPRVTLGDEERRMFGTVLGPVLKLGYAAPDRRIEEAAAAAAKADVAVVFAGQIVGEGMDRSSLRLPSDQDQLIEAVARANPRTVVVLTTGGAIAMPWLGKVSGVLQLWLPGDSFGTAAAALLFGDADPGGRLPVTFPADETQGPATRPSQYPGDPSPNGAVGLAHYDEGLEIGYRFFDAHGQTPLFPFGHGLSYTRFELSGLKASPGQVQVTVRNTGQRPGREVVQVYLGFPKSAGHPPRQLKGFAKLALAPGEAREVTIPLDRRAFEYWDEKRRRWAVAAGAYQVYVGRSSRELPLTAEIPGLTLR